MAAIRSHDHYAATTPNFMFRAPSLCTGFLLARNIAIENSEQECLTVWRIPRRVAGEHFVENDPGAPDVGPRIDVFLASG